MLSGCSKIGYVPLSDVTIDQAVQAEHRESKKFLRKNALPANTRLPKSDKFLIKGLKRNPTKLPEGEKLHIVKKQVSSAHKKKYKHARSSKNN
jgi:hypothetical protein